MKRRVMATLLCSALLALCFCGCKSKSKTAEITIVSSEWSGASAEQNSDKDEKTYTMKKDDSIELGGYYDLTIKVKSIADKKIVIETNAPMSDNEDGTINLNTKETEFTISKGEQLILKTPTMDAGNSYSFEMK